MRNYEGVRNNQTRELVLGAVFIVLGVVIPAIFHSTGIGGLVLLPMHFPILIGAFYLRPSLALLVGGIVPILSSLVTGMPQLFPIAVIMMFELATYGFMISFLWHRNWKNRYKILIVAMIVGRIVAGLVAGLLVALFGVQLNPILYVIGGITTGLPGIILQLLLIPPFVSRFARGVNKSEKDYK